MTPLSIALNRFGLGYRQGDSHPADPRAWLKGQIGAYRPYLGDMAQEDFGAARVEERVRATNELILNRGKAYRDKAPGSEQKVKEISQAATKETRTIMSEDVAMRVNAAVDTPTPFIERMVHFWSNHFAVSTAKARIKNIVGAYEFGAIRPHVTGKFADLVKSAVLHPAMLIYLDQFRSVGPGSSAVRGSRNSAGRGLNENLGREILELHTMGVNGGYSQADVLELAKALTGWVALGPDMVRKATPMPLAAGFLPARHEPGARTVMGRSYADSGSGQAVAIIEDLAVHPSTARHIATKLTRHFAGDDPPPAMIARLEKRFIDTGGDLAEVYKAIVDSPEAWAERPVKARQPFEWMVGVLRAAGGQVVKDWRLTQLLNELGQPTWGPVAPTGWDDLAGSWLAPDALYRRAIAAETIANRTRLADVRALAEMMFPGSLSQTTMGVLRGAESNQMALALVALSPEMLRR